MNNYLCLFSDMIYFYNFLACSSQTEKNVSAGAEQ